MPDYDFSLVDAAIIDTQHNTLRMFRDVLARMGIKKLETYNSVKDADTILTKATPDLVLVDADGEESEAFRFVRSLRNDQGSPNPFTCLIVTTWQPTPVMLMRTTNSGADDLLVKPISPKQVWDRISLMIESRKKFVVTADYTGPDRRKSPRDGAQVPLLDVPNTLRLKATNNWAHTNIRQQMAEAVKSVNEQKRLRASVQAAFLIEFAMEGLAATPPERMAVEHLARVTGVVEDLQRRLLENRSRDAIDAVCRNLKRSVERLVQQAGQGAVSADDLTVTQAVSRELMQAVDPQRPMDSMIREVSAAVAGYRNRLEQMALAKAEAARLEAAKSAMAAIGGDGTGKGAS